MVRVILSDIDIFIDFGVLLAPGALSAFEAVPDPKEPFFNEWPDHSGREYDESSPVVYPAFVYQVPFIMEAKDLEQYHKRKKSFLDLISNNKSFNFQLIDYNVGMKLRYKGASGWSFINRYFKGKIYARFELKLENNWENPSLLKYLTDNEGRFIIINESNKILVKA